MKHIATSAQHSVFPHVRILHVIASVDPRQGGPIEGIKQMTAVNHRYGHVVDILSLDHPESVWVQQAPFTVHALGPSWLGKWCYASKLVPWLKEHADDYDLIIINGIWQYHAFGTWRALRNSSTPYFVYTHGMLDPWFKRRYPLKHLKKWLFWPWSEYRVLRDAAAVMFTCEEERRLARQSFWLYQCNEFVSSYGTSAPPPQASEQRTAFLEKFPGLSTTRNLLFLGRVHEKKGADLLFRAFARVKSERPASELQNVRLVMAGPADHEHGIAMQRLASQLGLDDHVVWTGMVQGAAKWGAFRTASAFILPSHQENFGIAVAEALACEVPVLISNQVNIWREIEEAGGGCVEPDTLKGTVALIERWLDTPDGEWRAMRRRALACFNDQFLIDRAADSLHRAMGLFGVREQHELRRSPTL